MKDNITLDEWLEKYYTIEFETTYRNAERKLYTRSELSRKYKRAYLGL